MRRRLLGFAALAVASCAQPAPVEKPKPPPPPPLVLPPPAPTEPLDIQGRSAAIGAGKQAVVIFVNGHRVIEGTLSTRAPRGHFHGIYEGHEILAECELKQKVHCEVSVDGAPAASEGG